MLFSALHCIVSGIALTAASLFRLSTAFSARSTVASEEIDDQRLPCHWTFKHNWKRPTG